MRKMWSHHVEVQIEIATETKEDSFNLLRQFCDAIEEGDADDFYELSLNCIRRCRIWTRSCSPLYDMAEDDAEG